MKRLFKFMLCVAGVLILVRGVQCLIDYAYESLGKRYISSED